MTETAPHPSPLSASTSGGTGLRAREREGLLETGRRVAVLLPKIVVTALLALAIGDMIVGVFMRYVVVEITDLLDLDPINFFWVEEVGEFSLTWLTMIGAAVGLGEGIHFTLRVVTHRLPLRTQRVIHVANHLLIAGFGLLAAWYGLQLTIINSGLTSPALQINLGWVYASVAVGGALIFIYGIALALQPPIAVEPDQMPAAIVAGGE